MVIFQYPDLLDIGTPLCLSFFVGMADIISYLNCLAAHFTFSHGLFLNLIVKYYSNELGMSLLIKHYFLSSILF